MRTLNLPDPITAYFEADKLDGASVAHCFTKNGVVTDEAQRHVGTAAIAAWKSKASTRFAYTVVPLALQQAGQRSIVSARVTGDFPGSPVQLRYIFSLERGKIQSLEIVP